MVGKLEALNTLVGEDAEPPARERDVMGYRAVEAVGEADGAEGAERNRDLTSAIVARRGAGDGGGSPSASRGGGGEVRRWHHLASPVGSTSVAFASRAEPKERKRGADLGKDG